MTRRAFPFMITLIALLFAVVSIIGIGNLLLFTASVFEGQGEMGKVVPALVGLVLILLVGVVCSLLALRASNMPGVQLRPETTGETKRRVDLGAGYLVGQFVFFAVLTIVLLFVVMSLKR